MQNIHIDDIKHDGLAQKKIKKEKY